MVVCDVNKVDSGFYFFFSLFLALNLDSFVLCAIISTLHFSYKTKWERTLSLMVAHVQ